MKRTFFEGEKGAGGFVPGAFWKDQDGRTSVLRDLDRLGQSRYGLMALFPIDEDVSGGCEKKPEKRNPEYLLLPDGQGPVGHEAREKQNFERALMICEVNARLRGRESLLVRNLDLQPENPGERIPEDPADHPIQIEITPKSQKERGAEDEDDGTPEHDHEQPDIERHG